MLITEGWRYQGRLEKMVGLRQSLLKGQLRVGLSCVHATVHFIIMEESTKKIFKPKFELVQECNGLVSIHLGSTLLRLYFKGQKSLEPPRKIIKCWWCVIQFLETLPLTHWELGLKNCARTKQESFI
jgi:hypothetical protein